MRRIIAFLLVALMCISFVPCEAGPASSAKAAEKENYPTISAESVNVDAGATVDIDIVMSNNPGIVALDLSIGYESDVLTLKNVKKGTAVLSGGNTSFSPDQSYNPYKVVWVTTSANDTSNGTMLTLTFEVEKTAPECNSDITISVVEAKNYNNIPVIFDTVSGTVSIKPLEVHTVRFLDWDDTVLDTQDVLNGDAASAPADPVREGYTFSGWDKAFTSVTSDMDIKALYDIMQFRVVFRDWDDTPLKTEFVNYGSSATAPANPVREGYNFVMWDTDFSNVTADLNVKAVYQPQMFTVTFKNWDGTTIKRQLVQYGTSATAPSSPVREGYTFTGWDKDFSSIKADTVITAQYSINSYTVSYFVDGVLYDTQTYEFGAEIILLDEPQREGQTFSGWSEVPDTMPANNVNVYGSFDDNSYTVVFEDWDGTPLKVETVSHGEAATAPEDPTREGYTFTGWDTDFSNVTDNLTVTATYTINSYTVIFKNWDGTVLKTQVVEHGDSATAPQDPVRTGYTFTGWDAPFDCVTSDLTITAVYEINKYTVIFEDYDATVLKTETVEYGKAATAPDDPNREGYTFTGWNKDFSCVTENLCVTATYDINRYTVKFCDWNEMVIKTETVEHGSSATAPEDPVREGYIFIGWDTDFTNVTSNLVVMAQYEEILPEYDIGDVNTDNVVNTGDAVFILRYVIDVEIFTDQQKMLADFNRDGEINTGDAVAILRACVA